MHTTVGDVIESCKLIMGTRKPVTTVGDVVNGMGAVFNGVKVIAPSRRREKGYNAGYWGY